MIFGIFADQTDAQPEPKPAQKPAQKAANPPKQRRVIIIDLDNPDPAAVKRVCGLAGKMFAKKPAGRPRKAQAAAAVPQVVEKPES